MIRFIDEYRDRFLVEFICLMLKAHRAGGFITPGYRQAKARGPSARALREVMLVERITTIHQANYGGYGMRKM